MVETITVVKQRQLREIVHEAACVLTDAEFMAIINIFDRALERTEKEEEDARIREQNQGSDIASGTERLSREEDTAGTG